jgi:DNA repair protein RecN (Recombination protein N)
VLYELTVKDFGIIEEINWQPAKGLNVITGETGAGKSLVVDAVEALLSGRINEEDIRHGSEEARLEGVFRLPGNSSTELLRGLLSEKGLETGEDTLLIAGDFRRQGRTTPRVNRQAVSRSLLRDISAFLVDIHGQSNHLSLLNQDQHLEFLDVYAHNRDLRHDFGEKAAALSQAERELQRLSQNEQDIARQQELLKFQVEEITRADLQPGEDEALERELVLLTSAEKLKAAAYDVYRAIFDDDSALGSATAVDKVNEALTVLKQIVSTDPALQPHLDNLDGILHGLEELAREVRAYGEELNFDPQRLEEVQSRLELIRTLKRKYGGSIEGVLDYLLKAGEELEGLTYSDERREQLVGDIEKMKSELGVMAAQLSEKRRQASRKLVTAVQKELADLNMPQVLFDVSITQEKSPEGIPLPDGETYSYTFGGVDDVVFMASTNPGEPLKPLDKIASTGEISRFMLALKSALADADTIPVLIFDEIDIGVGGRSGEVIGKKLWGLAQDHQVICVTHLPQIAAFADAHFTVSKRSTGDRTVSAIDVLKEQERLQELAVMIGGAKYTPVSLDAAGELIRSADAWKNDFSKDNQQNK